MDINALECNTPLKLYLNNHTLEMKEAKLDDLTIVLVPSIFSASLGYRVTSANGWEPFDYDEKTKTLFVFHSKSRSMDNILWSLNKLVGHLPDIINSIQNKLYEGQHTKGIAHLVGSNSRVIAVGNLNSYQFYYESNKDNVAELTEELFSDIWFKTNINQC